MKRLHVHVTVRDLEPSIGFYKTLFGRPPLVEKDDYAKWILDDPRVNFAISATGSDKPGFDHLGIEVESAGELADLTGRLKAAEESVVEQKQAACCHVVSDKAWVADPDGVGWEAFHTTGEATHYGDDRFDVRGLPPRVNG